MWRAFFLAIGATAALLGVECLLIDKAILVKRDGPASAAASATPPVGEIVPPDWAPWSLISLGAVVILYSFTVPKKLQG
jgi:hypothetical protein